MFKLRRRERLLAGCALLAGGCTFGTGSGPTTAESGAATTAGGTRAAADESRTAPVGAADAGTPSAQSAPRRSAGCGIGAERGDGFEALTLRVGDGERTFHVRVPSGYDPARAYPLVFRFHGRGGNGLSGGLGIERPAGDEAIVAAPDGLDAGWSHASEERDLLLFDAMLASLSEQYCVDLDRVFAYGFSAGGGFTNLLGCRRADVLRATAAIAGFDRADVRCEGTPLAAWFLHDRDDPAVPIAEGEAARDRSVRRNRCSAQVVREDGCVEYTGCAQGAPVVWCETRGRGHDIAGETAPAVVWRFFSALP